MNQQLLGFYRQSSYREIPGPRSDPGLLAMIRRWVPWAKDDSTTAWCAILRAEAAKVTGSSLPQRPFRALSWLTVGEHVPLAEALPGDTVILDRGKGRGHLGLYLWHDATRICLIGGNQRNRVCEDPCDIADLLGIRRFS